VEMFSAGPTTKIVRHSDKKTQKRKNKRGRDEEIDERLTGKQVNV